MSPLSSPSLTMDELALLADVKGKVDLEEARLLCRKRDALIAARQKTRARPIPSLSFAGTASLTRVHRAVLCIALAAASMAALRSDPMPTSSTIPFLHGARRLQTGGSTNASSCPLPCIMPSECGSSADTSSSLSPNGTDAGAGGGGDSEAGATAGGKSEPEPEPSVTFTPVTLPFNPLYILVGILVGLPCVIGFCMTYWLLLKAP